MCYDIGSVVVVRHLVHMLDVQAVLPALPTQMLQSMQTLLGLYLRSLLTIVLEKYISAYSNKNTLVPFLA
jgi:hypothetical protein